MPELSGTSLLVLHPLLQLSILDPYSFQLCPERLYVSSLMLRFGGIEGRRFSLHLHFYCQEFSFLILEGEGSSGHATTKNHLQIPRFWASFSEFPSAICQFSKIRSLPRDRSLVFCGPSVLASFILGTTAYSATRLRYSL